MTRQPPRLVLAGTWTLDALLPVIAFWRGVVPLDAEPCLAPYGQLFQQLLDPASLLRSNRRGGNVVCIRWEDLLPRGEDGAALLASRVDEVATALEGFQHVLPCLVIVGPSGADERFAGATERLAARLAGTPNLTVQDGAAAMVRYRVARVHDATADRFGHVPYGQDALAALGTTIARWSLANERPPVKVFAVDGDYTLWSGVVGEAGVDGLHLGDGHLALQRALRDQAGAGRLLCLLSKNEHDDARAVFDRQDMVLRWDDFVAHRVDWQPKPDNLRGLAGDLGLGLDSVVFLDDNPIECAQMRERSPATLTIRVPEDPARLPAFVDHLWLFDRQAATGEDLKRGAMYREAAVRDASRRQAGSLQAFMAGLGLEVDIAPVAPDEWPRLAQLTQRTNQFNASLLRLQEGQLATGAADAFHRAVRVRDRFGDYGLVGQVRAVPEGDALVVDLFMLSCRALGRGVEHRMLAAAGAHAEALGLAAVEVVVRVGERNTPVRDFLGQVSGRPLEAHDARVRIPAAIAAATAFDPAAVEAGVVADSAPSTAPDADGTSAATATTARDAGSAYERIAHDLTTAADILQAIAACSRPRPELSAGFVEPAEGLERRLAEIWRQVLRLDAVGAHDSFHDLGGRSIQLVQVHGLLRERLGVEVDITTLFQHPTVASLAAWLASTRGAPEQMDAASRRGRDMHDAQRRMAAARMRMAASRRPIGANP